MRTGMLLMACLAAAGCETTGTDDGAPPPAAPVAAARPARATPNQVPVWTLDGTRKTFGDFRRKVTVVAVWATWCKPCILELPYLQALHEAFEKDPDVAVLATCVGLDGLQPAAQVRAITDPLELTYPLLLDDGRLQALLTTDDPAGQAGSLLGEKIPRAFFASYPLTVVIGPGFATHRESGFKAGLSKADYVAQKKRLIDGLRTSAPPGAAD